MSSGPEKKNVKNNKQAEISKSIMNINWELPLHIIWVIFSKLPMPNLAACRLVCKTWNHLVLDFGSTCKLVPNTFFVGIANNKIPLSPMSPMRPMRMRPWEQQISKMYCFNFEAKYLEGISHGASFEFDPDWWNVKIINACNGLLCILHHLNHDTICIGILNPMTNEYIQLLREESHETYYYTFGFGFSSKTKQYKVVRVHFTCRRYCASMVEIFTFGGSNKWSCVDDSQSLRIFQLDQDGVYFNGSLYWTGIDSVTMKKVIYCMDVEDEKFEVIPLPIDDFSSEAIWASDNNIYVTLKDRACRKFQVWMMQNNGGENSWIRKFVGDGIRADWGILPRQVEHLQLIKVYEDGEILFLVYGFHLFLYNPNTGKIKTSYDYIQRSIRTSWVYQIESLNFDSLENILGGNG